LAVWGLVLMSTEGGQLALECGVVTVLLLGLYVVLVGALVWAILDVTQHYPHPEHLVIDVVIFVVVGLDVLVSIGRGARAHA
jgi:hypothetical protein